MLTAENISESLLSVVAPDDQFVMMHSSLRAFGIPPKSVSDGLLAAINRLTETGVTFAIPAFTFNFCSEGIYHFRDSKPETGSFATIAMSLPNAQRSPNAIFSFIVCGPRQQDLIDCQSNTTWGDGSPFSLFEEEPSSIVMVGCDWNRCTHVHLYEEKAKVPYRYYKDFAGTADYGSGAFETSARMFVRNLSLQAENDFHPAINGLRAAGAVRSAKIGTSQIEAVSVADLGRTVSSMLADDPWALVENATEIKEANNVPSP